MKVCPFLTSQLFHVKLKLCVIDFLKSEILFEGEMAVQI